MNKNISKTKTGVKISFTGFVQKEQIDKMIENCAKGKCECMSDETKAKIEAMEVSGKDGDVQLELKGDMSENEIKLALEKSKFI